MEIVGRISRGSRMDQIYIPKQRNGFNIGERVIVRTMDTAHDAEKPFFYGITLI